MLIQISYLGITEVATLKSVQLNLDLFYHLLAIRGKGINDRIYSFME